MEGCRCIDLEERFGRRYRVGYEESYAAQYGRGARRRDPWLLVIWCRWGHVFPYGGSHLAASVDGHVQVANRLRRLSCCRVIQDGDGGELTAVFDVADFRRVAQVIRPRRRRRLSDRQRAEATARILAAGKLARIAAQNGSKSAPECDGGTQGGLEVAETQPALF